MLTNNNRILDTEVCHSGTINLYSIAPVFRIRYPACFDKFQILLSNRFLTNSFVFLLNFFLIVKEASFRGAEYKDTPYSNQPILSI